jgi:prolyl oligopeptidase
MSMRQHTQCKHYCFLRYFILTQNSHRIANDGTKFYIQTNKDADMWKMITIDLSDPNHTQTDLIPEDKNAYLEQAVAVSKDKLALVYKRDVCRSTRTSRGANTEWMQVKDEVYIHDLSTGQRLKRVASDFVGSMSLAGDRINPWVFVTMTGFTTPAIIGQYDFSVEEESKRWAIRRRTNVRGLQPEDFIAEQVWYTSKDGTKVPMFIVRHKSVKIDGTAPAIQYGTESLLD